RDRLHDILGEVRLGVGSEARAGADDYAAVLDPDRAGLRSCSRDGGLPGEIAHPQRLVPGVGRFVTVHLHLYRQEGLVLLPLALRSTERPDNLAADVDSVPARVPAGANIPAVLDHYRPRIGAFAANQELLRVVFLIDMQPGGDHAPTVGCEVADRDFAVLKGCIALACPLH